VMRSRPSRPEIRGGVDTYKDTLRRLTIRDTVFIDRILQHGDENVARSRIDGRAHGLVRVGALVAADAGTPSFMEACDAALAADATRDEIAGTLIAVLPLIGVARVVAAAPNLALALGYDVSEALEAHDGRMTRDGWP
jgi:4-carboxymuconolactone decarboxylase